MNDILANVYVHRFLLGAWGGFAAAAAVDARSYWAKKTDASSFSFVAAAKHWAIGALFGGLVGIGIGVGGGDPQTVTAAIVGA